jgi:hypothetical protein
MSSGNEHHVLLSEKGERVRRNLIAFSLLLVLIAGLNDLPDQIPLLGVGIDSKADVNLTIGALFLIQAYLILSFVACAGMDFVFWLKKVWQNEKGEPDWEIFGDRDLDLSEMMKRNKALTSLRFFFRLDQVMSLVFPFVFGAVGIAACISLALNIVR